MSTRSKSTREHLIDVGVELMHQHGYQATGVTEIVNTADVPKGSFYHYFDSKEDFAAAALERYIARAAQHSATVLNDSRTPPLKRLKRYFLDLIKVYGQDGPIPGCMVGRFTLEISTESQLRKQISSSFAHWQQRVATVIQEAVTHKELPANTDPESLAGFLLNSWQVALLRSQAEKNDVPLETFIHYVFDELFTKESKVKAGGKKALTH